MNEYIKLVKYIKDHGVYKKDRTNTGTLSVFGYQCRFDLKDSFPLIGEKYTSFKTVYRELMWFLSGSTNIKYLNDHNVRIWNEWANEKGELGPIYGRQWRDFNGVDQISNVISDIKSYPDSRRLLVSTWNPSVLPINGISPQDNTAIGRQALAPCHTLFQFYVIDNTLSCMLYQRSADTFLGVPYNIASYSLLTIMVAHMTGLTPNEFILTLGDAHLYSNHMTQVDELLARPSVKYPKLLVSDRDISDITDYKLDDFELVDYNPLKAISADIAV